LAVAALVVVMVASSAALVVQTRQLAREYDGLLSGQVNQALAARRMQVEFKRQVQEWKDILLRGFNPEDLAKYTQQFQAQDETVNQIANSLVTASTDAAMRVEFAQFRDAHNQLDAKYQESLTVFVASKGTDPRTSDRMVRGLDRPPTALLDGIVDRLVADVAASAKQQKAAAAARERAVVMTAAATLLGVLVALIFLIARITRPLRQLTEAAERVARQALPEMIARIRDMPAEADPPHLPPVQVATGDELKDLGRAFTSVQTSAVALAMAQHRADRAAAEMLVSLGRRNQVLLGRMLSRITEWEETERDPDTLGRLFGLDHAATRIRRNAESMLVLAGASQTRTWSRAVHVVDAVRAAVSEVEDYTRVDLYYMDGASIDGAHVADLVHLLAELIENATQFSPPNTQVAVIGQHVEQGYRIRVIDQGIGMTARELDEANDRIGHGASGWTVSKLLGLYVVGRLAVRHQITVTLEASAGRGITANVTLPPVVLAHADRRPTLMHDGPEPTGSRDLSPWMGPGSAPVADRALPQAAGASVQTVVETLSVTTVPRLHPSLAEQVERVEPPFTEPMRAPVPAVARERPAMADRGLQRPPPYPTGTAPPSPDDLGGAGVPIRVKGARLAELGLSPVPEAVAEPPMQATRWKLRSYQLDVEAARLQVGRDGVESGVKGEPSPNRRPGEEHGDAVRATPDADDESRKRHQ
jgi:signal transduction histidine kinase